MAHAPDWLLAELIAERYGPITREYRQDRRTVHVEYHDTDLDRAQRRRDLLAALPENRTDQISRRRPRRRAGQRFQEEEAA